MVNIVKWAREHGPQSEPDRSVLLWVASRSNGTYAEWPGCDSLAVTLGLPLVTIVKVTDRLSSGNIISINVRKMMCTFPAYQELLGSHDMTDTRLAAGVKSFRVDPPVEVLAVQLTDTADRDAIAEWCGGTMSDDLIVIVGEDQISEVAARNGDWIIQGVTGKFFVRAPDVFSRSYIEVGTR